MTLRFGAIHEPDHECVSNAIPFQRVGAGPPPNWFEAWNWHPDDGDILGNDLIGCCVPAADLRLIQAWKARADISWSIPIELVRLRYEAVGGWLGTPETDLGTITQADCFDWSLSPIIAGEPYPVTWTIVEPGDVLAALRHGPLLVTISLEPAVQDDPMAWGTIESVSAWPRSLHRVVAGAVVSGKLWCVTYGMIVPVDVSRVVACDLMEIVG